MTPTNIDQLTDFGVWILENQPELFDAYLKQKPKMPEPKPPDPDEPMPQYHKPRMHGPIQYNEVINNTLTQ